jgi:hypothetical protein
MVHAPGDPAELDVVWEVVERSHRFALRRSTTGAVS